MASFRWWHVFRNTMKVLYPLLLKPMFCLYGYGLHYLVYFVNRVCILEDVLIIYSQLCGIEGSYLLEGWQEHWEVKKSFSHMLSTCYIYWGTWRIQVSACILYDWLPLTECLKIIFTQMSLIMLKRLLAFCIPFELVLFDCGRLERSRGGEKWVPNLYSSLTITFAVVFSGKQRTMGEAAIHFVHTYKRLFILQRRH